MESSHNISALNNTTPREIANGDEQTVQEYISTHQASTLGLVINSTKASQRCLNPFLSPREKKDHIMNTQQKMMNKLKHNYNRSNLSPSTPKFQKKIEARNTSSHAKVSKDQIERGSKGILYKGERLYTGNDIAKFFNFSPQASPLDEQDKNIESKKFVDEEYIKLLKGVRPKKKYYQFGLGDKLLFLDKVDKLKYDIVDEERKRKIEDHERYLERARKQLEIQ